MTDQDHTKGYGGTAAENYQRFFVPSIGRPVAEGLIEVARLQPGERVLDVACGTGVVTRLAAERVGAAGRVTGLNVNPGMLTVARSETPSNVAIDWCEASDIRDHGGGASRSSQLRGGIFGGSRVLHVLTSRRSSN